jgi:hypothetical protein
VKGEARRCPHGNCRRLSATGEKGVRVDACCSVGQIREYKGSTAVLAARALEPEAVTS